MRAPFEYTHVISAEAVGLIAEALTAQVKAGIEAPEVDAACVAVMSTVDHLRGLGASLISAPWLVRSDGSVEVLFGLPTAEDLVLAKLAL